VVHLQIVLSINNFSLIHSVLTGSGASLASYSKSTGCSFPGVKGSGAYHSPASTVEFSIDTQLPSPQKDAFMNDSGKGNAFFFIAVQPTLGPGHFVLKFCFTHNLTHTHPVGLL
jgi:hypothetical protein